MVCLHCPPCMVFGNFRWDDFPFNNWGFLPLVFGVRYRKILFRVKGKYYNMTEETRKRKRNKIDTLTELKTEARFNIWQLGKWGYSVEKEASADDIGSEELEWSDIYSFESFRIFEKGKCIFKGCGYVELRNFTKLVKRYKHSHGVKNLHTYTDEILAQI